jgi:hypothetical protein
MKMSYRKFGVKVIVVMFTVATTHVVTLKLKQGQLFARIAMKTPSPLIEDAPPGLSQTAISTESAIKAIVTAHTPVPAAKWVGSSARLLDSSIKAGDKTIKFAAKVDLSNKNLEQQYMWSIRVFDLDNPQIEFTRHYDNQLFTLPASGQMTATFQEEIGFDPGDYRVELALYKIKPSFDITRLTDDQFAQRFLCVRLNQKVSVLK